MLILTLVMVFPFIYVIAVSFSSYQDAVSNSLLIIPLHPTIQAYTWVLNNGSVSGGLLISLFSATVGTTISMFLTVTMAYALSRSEFIGTTLAIILLDYESELPPDLVSSIDSALHKALRGHWPVAYPLSTRTSR